MLEARRTRISSIKVRILARIDLERRLNHIHPGIDLVQEKIFKAGDQSNESAAEQVKDNMIADAIRSGYKTAVGKDFPIAEKEKKEEASPLSGFASAASGFFGQK